MPYSCCYLDAISAFQFCLVLRLNKQLNKSYLREVLNYSYKIWVGGGWRIDLSLVDLLAGDVFYRQPAHVSRKIFTDHKWHVRWKFFSKHYVHSWFFTDTARLPAEKRSLLHYTYLKKNLMVCFMKWHVHWSRDFQYSMSKALVDSIVLLAVQVIVNRPWVFTIEFSNKGKQRNVVVLSWKKRIMILLR